MPTQSEELLLPAFPLGNTVLFPGILTEFMIFEPRYIQMIEHCLDSKGLFCFCTLVGDWQETYNEAPDLFPYGCICSIAHYEKQPDGRYYIVVKAMKRVKITEVPSEQLYRTMKTTTIPYVDDLSAELDENSPARSLITRFIKMKFNKNKPANIDSIIDELGLGHFLPGLCHELDISVSEKLDFLKETSLTQIFLSLKKHLPNEP